MTTVSPTPDGFALAAQALAAGEVVAYPTETVYGLGVNPFSETALERLFAAKGRDENKPVLLIIADCGQLPGIVSEFSEIAQRFAGAFWPGPLSLLLPRAKGLPDAVTASQPSVCVRRPKCPIARGLCQAFGGAITSTSANPSGQAPALSLAEIELPGITLGIDGGVLVPSLPSTVFDPETGRVIRPGAVPSEALAALR